MTPDPPAETAVPGVTETLGKPSWCTRRVLYSHCGGTSNWGPQSKAQKVGICGEIGGTTGIAGILSMVVSTFPKAPHLLCRLWVQGDSREPRNRVSNLQEQTTVLRPGEVAGN